MSADNSIRAEVAAPCKGQFGACLDHATDNRFIDIRQYAADDIGEYGQWHRDLNMDFMQLEAGKFSGNTCYIDLHDAFIAKRRSNLRFFAIGNLPGHILFAFPVAQKDDYFCKKGLYDSKVNQIISNDETDFCAIIPNSFENLIVGLKISELPKYLSKEEANEFVDLMGSDRLIKVPDNHHRMSSYFVNQSYDEISRIQNHYPERQVLVGQRCKLLVLFLYQFIRDHRGTDDLESEPRSYEKIVDRGLRYIHSKNGAAVTLDELSSKIYSSKRSIQYAFSELVGLTPLEFSKLLRLNAIRSDLLGIRQKKATVAHILHNYHIGNSGRFRHEYFDLFNEYPKDTLVRTLG